MKRRDFIKTVGASGLGLIMGRSLMASDPTVVGGMSAKRLNVLYIFTDQQFAESMSCAGNPWVKTPAMDSLAATGARFNLTYTTHPVCSPARASMLTGFMPHEMGINGNMSAHDSIPEKIRPQEMGWIFKNAGYRCAYGGKAHVPDYGRLEETHGFEVLSDNNGQEVTSKCVEFLSQKQTEPFLLMASFDEPHQINDVTGSTPISQSLSKWIRGKDTIESISKRLPPPPSNLEPASTIPDMATRKGTGTWTKEDWRQYLYIYYRLVEGVDAKIGAILKALRDSGQEENTLVIFSSDHGDGLGAHHTSGKNCFYEEMSRVPFILSLKGVTKPGLVDQNHMVCCGLDLMPTMCDYTGVTLPAGLRGRSVKSLAEGKSVEKWRNNLVIEAGGGGVKGCEVDRARMVRSSQYKYNLYKFEKVPPQEELFDMQKDPGEINNLATKAEFQGVLKEHKELLATWCKETNDTFLSKR